MMSSTSLELQPLELMPGDLLRPLGAFEELFCLFDQFDLQTQAVSSNLTVEQASQLKRNAFNAQVMFTNLGRLPFDSTFGHLKLETLWAPCGLRGIEGEQTLGAVTVNGSLHLTHTSPVPTPRLLAALEEVLRRACMS